MNLNSYSPILYTPIIILPAYMYAEKFTVVAFLFVHMYINVFFYIIYMLTVDICVRVFKMLYNKGQTPDNW